MSGTGAPSPSLSLIPIPATSTVPSTRLGSIDSGTMYHSQLMTPVHYSIEQIPDSGDAQTAAVIGYMRQYAIEDSASPEIRRDVQTVLGHSRGADPVQALWAWTKHHISFVPDVQTAGDWEPLYDGQVVEALIRPRDMSALIADGHPQGDCDDFSMYLASLLLALGVPCAFVTVAANPASIDYSHVYVVAYPEGERVPLDASHGEYPGWETPYYNRRQEWGLGLGIGASLLGSLIASLLIGVVVWVLYKRGNNWVNEIKGVMPSWF